MTPQLNLIHSLVKAALALLNPPPALRIWEWAELRRRMGRNVTAKPGRYQVANTPYMREPQESFDAPDVQTTVLYMAKRTGKALDIATKIPTPTGWKTMAEIKAGDFVFASNGKPCRVLFATDPMIGRPCNRVVFSDGAEIIADDDHLWETDFTRNDRRACSRKVVTEKRVLKTKDITKTLRWGYGKASAFCHAIKCCDPVDYPEKELPIPPYTFGAWLGDGHSYSGSIIFTKKDEQIIDEVKNEGFEITLYKDKRNNETWAAFLDSDKKRHKETFYKKLLRLGVLKNKHIPRIYLEASAAQRQLLFNGLMDTDGCVSESSGCEFVTTSEKIANGFLELALSLGYKVKGVKSKAKLYGRVVSDKWRFGFIQSNDRIVFRLKRKQARLLYSGKLRAHISGTRKITAIIPVESRPVKCIQVDSEDHCYLASDSFIKTHNTESELNLVGSKIEQSPSNILVVYPTLDSAKKWSKQFFEPMRKSTPAIRRLIGDRRSKESNNTILQKEFPGGTISAIGSNSPSGFRQVQAPIVICDECDSPDYNTIEGDGVTLAFGRAENYSNSVQVVSSTATEITTQLAEGEVVPENFDSGSRIHNWWLKSDQRKWFCRSPCCDHWHVLMWANVKWPEGHQHELAWYECPNCHAHWDDAMRIKAIMAGEWRATAPFHGVRGYWLNGINTLFSAKKGYKSKLHQMAAEFWDAYTSGEEARKVWMNTFLCEPKYVEPEKIDASPFYERLEDYQPDNLPEDICVIGLQFDVQGDRLEYEFVGLGEEDETWGIEYGKIQGDPEKDAVWKTLGEYTKRAFKREDGVELRVDFIAGDHRHKGSRVRAFLKKCGHPRAYAMYGAGGPDKQSLLVIPHKNKHYRMNLFSVGTDTAKDILFARMKISAPGPRYMHFPRGNGYDRVKDGYFDQLTAEEMKLETRKGKTERFYQKRQGRERNEALDLRVYFLAGIDTLRPAVSVIKRELKRKLANENYQQPIQPASRIETEEKPVEQPKPRPVQRPAFPRGGGFVNGWRH